MSKLWLYSLGAAVIGLLTYILGLKFLLPLVGLAACAFYLPMPSLFNSWLSRGVVSLLVNICVLQAVALAQFLIWPQSNFMFVAVVYAVIIVALILFNPSAKLPKFITRRDIYALIAPALFLLPFLSIVFGQNSTLHITQIGGLQSPDASHHFEFINAMIHEQHLDKSGYPKSFHLSLGFIQDAFVGTQQALSWQTNVKIFFSHYLIFGGTLAFVLYFLCVAFIKKLTPTHKFKPIFLNCLIGLGLGLPLAILTMWPFLEHGFLNYYFTIATVATGVICLLQKQRTLASLMFFGAAASWSLIAPALVLILGLAWPIKKLGDFKSIKLTASLAFVALPALMQALYPSATAELNALGALRTLHILVLLAGLILVGYILKKLPTLKNITIAVYLPFMLLVAGLVALQLFMLGEVRYYPIKVALLLETLLLVLGVAVLFGKYLQSDLGANILVTLPFVPLLTLLLLLAPYTNPLKDTRDLFRDYSGQGRPAYYNQDVTNYAMLGSQGKIDHFNSTILHYNPQDQKLTGHTLLAQWAQFIKYPRQDPARPAWACHRLIYHNMVYGSGSPVEQAALVAKVKECADIAAQAGQSYYIITDSQSVDYLKSVFGGGAVYVSQ